MKRAFETRFGKNSMTSSRSILGSSVLLCAFHGRASQIARIINTHHSQILFIHKQQDRTLLLWYQETASTHHLSTSSQDKTTFASSYLSTHSSDSISIPIHRPYFLPTNSLKPPCAHALTLATLVVRAIARMSLTAFDHSDFKCSSTPIGNQVQLSGTECNVYEPERPDAFILAFFMPDTENEVPYDITQIIFPSMHHFCCILLQSGRWKG